MNEPARLRVLEGGRERDHRHLRAFVWVVLWFAAVGVLALAFALAFLVVVLLV